jgi:carbon starvation protein
MHGWRYVWISLVPLAWLITVTFSAGIEKIFSPAPRIGFLAQATQLETALASGKIAASRIAETQTLIFNAKLDAAICVVFLILVAIILIDSLRVWAGILTGARATRISETPFVPTQLSTENL